MPYKTGKPKNLDEAMENFEKGINQAHRYKKFEKHTKEYGFKNYVKKISELTGLDKTTVESSEPAQNYKDFANNPPEDRWYDKAIENKKKWAEEYKKAFSTTE